MEREQTTIRLPAKLKKQLQQEADKLGMPMKDLIILIVRDYFGSTVLK